jgi:TaqI-like C-terminal specificity domain/Eco57I restriction-modification methylase/N-6 DNA Methylase
MRRDIFAQPLFSPKLLKSRFAALPIPEAHRALVAEWHGELKGGLGKQKEEAIVSAFLKRFFGDILGYQEIGSAVWTLDRETRAANGKVDAALGTFTHDIKLVVAPFELKGPKTSNLDALMAGRLKSPVQQAWEYANDLPGSQFVLVSNCDEIRLYALGYGRAAYECWHTADLLDPQQYANFVGLLGQHNLTSGSTQKLLKDNAVQEREVTEQLYADYKTLRQDLILGLHNQNPGVIFDDLVRHAQKLIDRLLFIAFAESRSLLPAGSIVKAVKNVDAYNPQPKWHNFRGLFKAVDTGNPFLDIPPYNGGLFAPDEALDNLKVSDKLVEKFTVLAGYDYEQEVSVTVLGRIFEQSISDLEHIANLGNIDNFKLTTDKATLPAAKKGSVAGKRKRDGVVYTPDHITRFIVDKTLTPVILERFNAIYTQFRMGSGSDEVWRKPSKDEKALAPKSTVAENVTEYWFWKAWEQSLTQLRVCDPSCGSGAFLVAAFDVLKEAYNQLNLRVRELDPASVLNIDISHTILKNNLFGVDINAESIEITKLSLWLKTAERDHKLAGLEANFYQGNSLVADKALDPLAFDWQTHFSHIFSPDSAMNNIAVKAINTPTRGGNASISSFPRRRESTVADMDSRLRGNDGGDSGFDAPTAGGFDAPTAGGFDAPTAGGFDVILGNPPYVRQELFTNLKPYLHQHYSTYHGVADLYVYFYELGLNKLLAAGGRLGYISSSSFFKTSSGEPLRRLLRQQGQIETLVDFGDWQVFEGVTTYPAIVVLQKVAADDAKPAQFLQLTGAVPDLAACFEESKQSLNLAQLSGAEGTEVGEAAEWQLEGIEASALRDKLTHGHPSLKQAVGSPYRGVLTGLNEAFVIDRATRDRLVFEDYSSLPLFKPFLEGKDIKRWQVESEDRWLILMPKGWTKSSINMPVAGVFIASAAINSIAESDAFAWLQTRHPHLAAYLAPFADAARKRTDKGDYWWELRACAYYGKFDEAKILYPDISQGSKFCFDAEGQFFGNTAYFVQTKQAWLAALLNSRAVWFYLSGVCEALRGGEWRLRMFTQQIETLPIPDTTELHQTELTYLSTACAQAAKERLTAQRDFGRRILDLLPTPMPKGAQASLGDKLGSWWQLDDFKAFQFEVQKRFKSDIPLRDRNDWEQWFAEGKSHIQQLSHNIAASERGIDAIVYTLFGLNAAEVALVERAVQR